jgi:tetratricopeptide (TPR) repeat protein
MDRWGRPMPHTNPGKSFETASRHLFRHINDLNALRSNPLAVSFFDCVRKNEEDRVSLVEFHAKILMIARAMTGEWTSGGLKSRALRQLEIVVALCEGERSQDTANRLGLSERHYYRERRAICNRVSRALLEEASKRNVRFEVTDALRFLLARTAALIDQGFPRKAASVLEDAYGEVLEGTAKSAVRSALARALLSLGFSHRASELLSYDCARASDPREGNVTSDWARDHLTFTEALIAIESGDHARAGRVLEALARRRIADHRTDEESVATVVACGQWYCLNGAFSKARIMLQHARRFNRCIRHSVPSLEINIALLAASCADDPEAEFGLEYEWLSEAKALSVSSASAEGALNAISGLLGYHASIGNNDAIYFLSEEGLQVAQATESTLFLQFISTQIIQGMLWTPCWRAVAPLLFEIEEFVQPSSFRWAVLKHLQGNFLRRTGQYGRAKDSLDAACGFMQNTGTKALEAIIVRDLAVTQHQAGETSDSIESIRRALELAEGHSSALSLCITYETAARLLKERRIMRLAQQARATLAMRRRQLPDVKEGSRAFGISTITDQSRPSRIAPPRLTLAIGQEIGNNGGKARP